MIKFVLIRDKITNFEDMALKSHNQFFNKLSFKKFRKNNNSNSVIFSK